PTRNQAALLNAWINHLAEGRELPVSPRPTYDSSADEPSDVHHYARPLSMKACPPNYWMTGVRVVERQGDDNLGEIQGFQTVVRIEELICHRKAKLEEQYHMVRANEWLKDNNWPQWSDSTMPSEVRVPTDANDVDFPYLSCNLEWSLDQRLGELSVPVGGGVVARDSDCFAQGQIVGGFTLVENNDAVQGFDVICVTPP